MDERKVLVEVTAEEYEKIKAGILGEHIPTYEEVKKDLLENISEDDARTLVKKHYRTIVDNLDGETLVGQIIRRTQDTKHTLYQDPVSGREYSIINGTLKIVKRDYSKIDEPLYESDDTLEWTLKSYTEGDSRRL